MNFIPIDINTQNTIFTLGTVSSIYLLYKFYREKKTYQDEIKFVQNAQVFDDAFQIIKGQLKNNSKQKKRYLSRIQIDIQPVVIYYPIRSNQIYYVEPSSIPLFRQFLEIYNSKDPKKQNLLQICNKHKVNIGRIIQPDIFKVQRKYYSFQDLSNISVKNQKIIKQLSQTIVKYQNLMAANSIQMQKDKIQQYKKAKQIFEDMTEQARNFSSTYKNNHKSFLFYLSSFVESCFSFFRQMNPKMSQMNQKSQYRRPLFKGVLSGILQHKFSLIKNTNFLVKFSIQDGVYTPQLIASSKVKLLQFYFNKISSCNLKMGFFIGTTIVFGSILYHSIKKYIKIISLKLGLKGQKFLNPSQITDDKLCQICYVNCRNLLFLDCKHLVMCIQCYQHHKQTKCMICSKQINKVQSIYDSSKKYKDQEDQKQVILELRVEQY